MNEYVKAIKVVHQLLILASSAVLAFALTPDIEARYSKADKVLSFLQNCTQESWGDYVKTLSPTWKAEAASLERFTHHLDPRAPKLTVVPFAYGNLHFPVSSSVSEMVRYVEGRQKIQTMAPIVDSRDWQNQWDTNLAKLYSRPANGAVIAVDGNLKPRIKIMGLTLGAPGGSPAPNLASDSVHVIAPEYRGIDDIMRLLIILDPATMPSGFSSNTVAMEVRTIVSAPREEPFAMNWLRQQDPDHILIKSGTAAKDFFGPLEPFMGTLGGLEIYPARQKLQNDRDAQRGKLALFGLSVEADSTVDVMPWITSGVLLFFLAHLRQFRLAMNGAHRDAPPWVGFFDDWAGQLIAWMTIAVMPLFANWLLIKRHGREKNGKAEILALATVTLCSVWSALELYRTRRKLHHHEEQIALGDL